LQPAEVSKTFFAHWKRETGLIYEFYLKLKNCVKHCSRRFTFIQDLNIAFTRQFTSVEKHAWLKAKSKSSVGQSFKQVYCQQQLLTCTWVRGNTSKKVDLTRRSSSGYTQTGLLKIVKS